MRRIVTYRPTLGETALLILGEVTTAFIGSFYPHPYYHAFCSHTKRHSFQVALKRLERRYLVGTKQQGGAEAWCLTEEGKQLVRRLTLKLDYARQRRWDGKWRVVVFDIPEHIRERRTFLRRELTALGFHPLQKSVWITPYVLPGVFFEIITELGMRKHLRLITAERISDDQDLRSLFFP